MPVDADTDAPGAMTMKFGTGSVTYGMPRSGKFSDPAYLPGWAPMYPGAKVMTKLVQKDAKGVIGRGTDLNTPDPFAKVVDFYADAIARSGRTPVSSSRANTVATFVFEPQKGYNNLIVIRQLTGGNPPNTTIAIAVATDK
jgi:hypothetical protein